MNHKLTLSMEYVPQVAKRDRHALILLQNAAGNFLLGAKEIYPQNIYRMVGGGIEVGEESLPAAARELQEETGLTLPPDQLKHLSTITAEIDELRTGKHYTFVTDLFFANIGNQTLTPSDDIQGIQEVSPKEMQALIERYYELPTTIEKGNDFAWYDYGQLYGTIHQIALDTVQNVEST